MYRYGNLLKWLIIKYVTKYLVLGKCTEILYNRFNSINKTPLNIKILVTYSILFQSLNLQYY